MQQSILPDNLVSADSAKVGDEVSTLDQESHTDQINSRRSILFVPTTILFCLPIVLLIHQIGTNLKFGSYYSYSLLAIGGITILRSYLVSFLTLNNAYLKHKWLLFGFNLIAVIVTIGSAYNAIFDLSLNYFAQEWFVGITAANLLFLAQIWVNKIYSHSYIQLQLLQIVLAMISIGALWQKLFNGSSWFLNLLATVMLLFEAYLITGLIKILFKWEAEHKSLGYNS